MVIWMIDPVAFRLGPLNIYWYGVIMAFAFFAGTLMAWLYAPKAGINGDHVINMLILIIPASIIGARLYYVIFSWEQYRSNPAEIFAVWHGGLAIHGGLLGGLLAGYWYVRKNGLDFWSVGDLLAPSIILGQAIGRWGNFINREAYGYPVTPDFMNIFPEFIQKQMFIGGQYRHPTFLYESVWDFVVFLFLVFYRPRKRFSGEILLLYFSLYSIGRFFIEGLRTDSLMLGPFRTAQLASVLLILVCALFYARRRRAEKRKNF